MNRLSLLLTICMCILSSVSKAADSDFTLKESGEQKWFQGNMHTHSLWSDGDDFPEMIATWYQERGYDFLVFTDHNVLLRNEKWVDKESNKGGQIAFDKLKAKFGEEWIQTRIEKEREQVKLKTFAEVFERLAKPQQFLLIQGEEITDKFQNRPIHMCATNASELLIPMHGDSVVEVIQQNINAAISHRERTGEKTLVHLNHPNFGYAVTAEQLMQVVGENFFEVYNGHPATLNFGDKDHASTDRMWDVINTFRLATLNLPLMYGLATDDSHNYHRTGPRSGSQPGRGWVEVLADTLTPDALVTSLEAGKFYSSSGVALQDISFKDNKLTVRIAAEADQKYKIEFIGTRRNFDQTSRPAVEDEAKAAGITRIYSSDIGAVLKTVNGTSASYTLDGTELYVRAVVTSSKLKVSPAESGEFERAWVQPVTPNAK